MVSTVIRKKDITSNVSSVSALNEVREFLVNIQRKIGKKMDCVVEGRDIGSVVFPKADFKFFIDAKPEIRAKRRLAELEDIKSNQTQQTVLKDLNERDKMDSTRQIAPLKCLSDAFFIDSSSLNADEVLQIALNYING